MPTSGAGDAGAGSRWRGRPSSRPRRLLQPGAARRLSVAVRAERQQIAGRPRVVEDEHAVGEQQCGVGRVGAVGAWPPVSAFSS